MPIDSSTPAYRELKNLIPLNKLPDEQYQQLCSMISLESVSPGELLFSQGDNTPEFVYLLRGKVRLVGDGMALDEIEGGTSASRFALAHQLPRKVSARAESNISFIRVPSELMNKFDAGRSSNDSRTYEVDDIPEEDTGDWMTNLLRLPIFKQLPPANLQKVLRTMEEIPVKAGNRIIHQGDEGDYYYIIKRGRCVLTRRPTPNAKEIRLAELRTSDTFGEDALISGEPRNVNVTMATDGQLLRLNKEMFKTLIKDPVIKQVEFSAVDVAEDLLLDVRSPDLYEMQHIPDSINLPFFSLRMQLNTLPRERRIIVICDDGSTSEAACFLLIRNGFQSVVLQGGIYSAIPEARSVAPSPTLPEEPEPQAEEPFTAMVADNQPTYDDLPSPGKDDISQNHQLQELRNEISRLEAIVGQKDEELVQLRQELRDSRVQDAEKHQASPEAAQAEIEQLQNRIQELSRDGEAQTAQQEQAEQKIAELESIIREFEQLPPAPENKQEDPELMDQLLSLELKNKSLEKKAERNTQLKAELDRTVAAFEKLREQSSSNISRLQKEIEDLHSQDADAAEPGTENALAPALSNNRMILLGSGVLTGVCITSLLMFI